MRLGLFIDAAFRRADDGDGVRLFRGAGDFGFMHFAAAVGRHFGRLSVIARETDDPRECPNQLPPGLELAPLPYYPSLRHLGRVLRVAPGTVAAMWRALDQLDVVWVTGVHPLGLLLALMARVRGRRVVLLIRQDSPRYFSHRTGGVARLLAWVPVRLLDLAFRLLSRRMPTTVVGSDVARRYGAPREDLLDMNINLLAESDLVAKPKSGGWSNQVELLTVGRIDREKNPQLALRMLEGLERTHPGRFRLSWIGEGPMAERLAQDAVGAGLSERLGLPGYIPFGPDLIDRYRGADAFVHIALTEGVPQVLYEAMGSGLPIVATDVGGVAEALERGRAGLLVPPDDAGALVAASLRLEREPGLRSSLAARALELARRTTIERESARVAEFIRSAAAR